MDQDHLNNSRRRGVGATAAFLLVCGIVAVVAFGNNRLPALLTPLSNGVKNLETTLVWSLVRGAQRSDDNGDRPRQLSEFSKYEQNCFDRNIKKCKQGIGCKWDTTAGVCVHRLPGTFDPGDIPGNCQMMNQKQCKKDPACELWGPSMDICVAAVDRPEEISQNDNEELVQFNALSDPCVGKLKKTCKSDGTMKCQWSKKMGTCYGRKSRLRRREIKPAKRVKARKESDEKFYAMITSSNVADVVPIVTSP